MYPRATIPRDQLQERLQQQIDRGQELFAASQGFIIEASLSGQGRGHIIHEKEMMLQSEWKKWCDRTKVLLARSFTEETFAIAFYNATIQDAGYPFGGEDPLTAAIRSAVTELESIRDLLPELEESVGQVLAEPSHTTNQALLPWPVTIASLFDMPADVIVEVVSIAGLHLNWQLTQDEAYSEKTRKRTYRPRVDAAYNSLAADDKARVVSIIVKEVCRRDDSLADQLVSRLQPLGWQIIEGILQPRESHLRELFIGRGQEHDAYVEIRRILQLAQHSLYIVDPYVDDSLLTLIATVQARPLNARILTSKIPPDFKLEVQKFSQQHPQILVDVRRTSDFHDRFVIIDGRQCFHLGASIKDAGKKAFMMSAIEDSQNTSTVIMQQQSSWQNGTPL